METDSIFIYELRIDLGYRPVSRIELLDDGQTVICRRGLEEPSRITIDKQYHDQVKFFILENDRLLTMNAEDIERHPEYIVLDGYDNIFTFSNGRTVNSIDTGNVSILEGEHEACPNGAYLVDCFHHIAKILIKAGIGKEFFRLEVLDGPKNLDGFFTLDITDFVND